jgi:glycosyltransferase involved in cell wall biosynthesis
LRTAPVFSLVTPVYEPTLEDLQKTIDSVLSQTFGDWEWILVDDDSPSESVRTTLRDAARRDRRIRVIERAENGRIVAASNDGLAQATGEFIALLDHDDLLTTDALERVSSVVDTFDDVDYIYSDEDKVDQHGAYFDAFHKPDWSPERLRGQMYTSHLSVIRRTLVEEVGGFREGYDGSQDHDLVLRVTERGRRVVHIPQVLYHWRVVEGSVAADVSAKPYAREAGRRAVQDQLDRLGIGGVVSLVPGFPNHYRISRSLPRDRRVSIVIPTIGTSASLWGEDCCFVVEAVRSLLGHTEHENLEIVVVYDPPTPAEVLAQLRDIAGDKLVLVRYAGAFNFSKKVNLGVVASTGDRIVALNDDIQVISGHWLEELVAPLEEPDVGMTGAKLYFSDQTIQHAGHAYRKGGYFHPFIGYPRENPGSWGSLLINRECSGVTAACAAMRREVFDEVGGFSETLPVNFNDVDLSFKVRFRGYRILWLANCELYHFESRTRIRGIEPWEHTNSVSRWGHPALDPYLPEF